MSSHRAEPDHPLLLQVGSALAEAGLQDSRLVVGVSGGADSVSLLRALLQVCQPTELCVAHLDHQLRGAASTADAKWVAELCAELHVEHVGEVRDVSRLAGEWGIGIEETARRARYEFLETVAASRQASAIALAHTADDQAETVLHHILRGTGLAGLQGMSLARQLPSGVQIVRPMLSVRRSELLAFLASLGQEFRDDLTNVDPAYTRNRIRGRLLPMLAEDFNPQVTEGLLRLSHQASDVQEAMEQLAVELLDVALAEASPDECRLRAAALTGRPRHLLREMFVQLWRRQNWPRQKMGFGDWDRLVEVALFGTAVSLPGPLEARRKRDVLTIRDLRFPTFLPT